MIKSNMSEIYGKSTLDSGMVHSDVMVSCSLEYTDQEVVKLHLFSSFRTDAKWNHYTLQN